jgi:hypothetical protein
MKSHIATKRQREREADKLLREYAANMGARDLAKKAELIDGLYDVGSYRVTPEYRDQLIAKFERKAKELFDQALSLLPEDFCRLRSGGWVSWEWLAKQQPQPTSH